MGSPYFTMKYRAPPTTRKIRAPHPHPMVLTKLFSSFFA
jgi:hypothetical protein